MGCYLKGFRLVRLFLLEYPLSEAKKNSLLWECPIRMKRPDYLKVPLEKNGEKVTYPMILLILI